MAALDKFIGLKGTTVRLGTTLTGIFLLGVYFFSAGGFFFGAEPQPES
jgi:hypothetical protein